MKGLSRDHGGFGFPRLNFLKGILGGGPNVAPWLPMISYPTKVSCLVNNETFWGMKALPRWWLKRRNVYWRRMQARQVGEKQGPRVAMILNWWNVHEYLSWRLLCLICWSIPDTLKLTASLHLKIPMFGSDVFFLLGFGPFAGAFAHLSFRGCAVLFPSKADSQMILRRWNLWKPFVAKSKHVGSHWLMKMQTCFFDPYIYISTLSVMFRVFVALVS